MTGNESDPTVQEGGCVCGQIRFRVEKAPLFVHCCHCSWCQRETGSAFAVNALIESEHVTVTRGETETTAIPSASGKGQRIVRCPECRVALWSHYAGAGALMSFVRVGTLDEPSQMPPDIHIFTDSKLPWVRLPEGVPARPAYYSAREFWPAESLERMRTLKQTESSAGESI
jgi:hypothetical protein